MNSRDELDEQLQKLAMEAQQYQPATKERQKALTKLIIGVQKSGKLYRPKMSLPPAMYADVYSEALQKVLLQICHKIDSYDPQRASVIAWVNFLLGKKFIDTVRERSNQRVVPMPDNLIAPISEISDIQILKNYLEEDPDNIFKATHVKKNPAANFQTIALGYLEGKSWQEMSLQLGSEVSTLSSFYQRSLTKFAPALKQHLQN